MMRRRLPSSSTLDHNLKKLRVMKKIYIAMAILATVSLISCEQKQSFEEFTPLDENDIAFYIGGSSSATRAEAVQGEVKEGVSIPVGNDNEGNPLYFEETIEYLNPSPATRGIPAYTENLGKVYTTMGVYTPSKGLGDATFGLIDTDAPTENPAGGKGWRYRKQYDGKYDPWEDETTEADFYFRMPASESGASEFAYANGTIDFDFGASLNGADQQDILFGYTSINKEDHDDYLPKGTPVTMYHALTGVKFRVGNDNTGTTKTIITKIEFTGLYGSGHCTITPSGDGTVEWSNLGTNGVTFSQEYTNPSYTPSAGASNSDGTVDFAKPTEGDAPFGDSWYAGKTGVSDRNNKDGSPNTAYNTTNVASGKNLNAEDGSLTFWFIPQKMTENVKLKVTFCIKTPDTYGTEGGGMITHEINFGQLLAAKNVVWNAGELRTYTLEPTDVDVAIFDDMDGLEKDNLHVTNTGNVDEYVRVMVIGNWYDSDGNILVGYKYPSDATTFDEGDDINTMVTPWYREDPTYSEGFDDTFEGGRPSGNNQWVRGTGSYFYYPSIIGAGEYLSSSQALFQSYKLDEDMIPEIWIPSGGSGARVKAEGVHLVMEVVVQAISAYAPDGSQCATCWEAWTAATGQTIAEKPYTD